MIIMAHRQDPIINLKHFQHFHSMKSSSFINVQHTHAIQLCFYKRTTTTTHKGLIQNVQPRQQLFLTCE